MRARGANSGGDTGVCSHGLFLEKVLKIKYISALFTELKSKGDDDYVDGVTEREVD